MSEYRSVYQPNIMARQYRAEPRNNPRRTPYEILVRQSRLLGRTAAKAYDATRRLLQGGVMPHTHAQSSASPAEEKRFYEDHPDRLHQVVEQSREVLAGARTVILPYNLFPDTITVDRMRVTITQRTFFWSADVVSLRIEDILNISAGLGPIFGSLRISTRVMNSIDHFEISGFWRRDAIRLKRIIEGFIIAINEGVDVSSLSSDRLVRKLNELGGDPEEVR